MSDDPGNPREIQPPDANPQPEHASRPLRHPLKAAAAQWDNPSSDWWGRVGWFTITLVTGLGMVASSWWLPKGNVGDACTLTCAILFAISFVVLLVTRLKRIYAGHHFWVETTLVLLSFAGGLLAFAMVYKKVGILDTTVTPQARSYEFIDCLYLAIVTFTTLGYGDFIPRDQGRAVACVQAVTGYVVLALTASTAASLLQASAQSRMRQQEGNDSPGPDFM